MKALGDVIDIYDAARIPLNSRQRAERQGLYPYYGAAGIMDHVDDFLFDGVYVLTGEDGTVANEEGYPAVQYVWGQFWVNNHAHVMRGAHGISDEHLYLFLQQARIVSFVTGAVQPKLNQKNLKSIPFVLPQQSVCQAFAHLEQPIFATIRSNSDASVTLTAQRDALLPGLVSGRCGYNLLTKKEIQSWLLNECSSALTTIMTKNSGMLWLVKHGIPIHHSPLRIGQ